MGVLRRRDTQFDIHVSTTIGVINSFKAEFCNRIATCLIILVIRTTKMFERSCPSSLVMTHLPLSVDY